MTRHSMLNISVDSKMVSLDRVSWSEISLPAEFNGILQRILRNTVSMAWDACAGGTAACGACRGVVLPRHGCFGKV